MPELNIPTEHHNKLKFYVSLPIELKSEVCGQLSNAPIGLSQSALIDFVANKVTKLSKERISDIHQIFFNLIKAKESLNVELNDFLEILANSLSKTGVEELQPTPEIMSDFSQMLSNSGNTLITTKMIDLMTENQKIFVNVKIYQDIRPAFDDTTNKLLGSVIIHNVKINFEEDNIMKEIYFALDSNDVEMLILQLKKAQEKEKTIKSHFVTAKLIEIK